MNCTYVYEEESDAAAVYGESGALLTEDSFTSVAHIIRETACDVLRIRRANYAKIVRCYSVGDFGGGPEECDLEWPDTLEEEWLQP